MTMAAAQNMISRLESLLPGDKFKKRRVQFCTAVMLSSLSVRKTRRAETMATTFATVSYTMVVAARTISEQHPTLRSKVGLIYLF